MATQKAWFRFSGHQGSAVIGRVDVPREAPVWFQPTLVKLSEGKPRVITMEDLSASEWLDFVLSANLSIYLYKPMSVKVVPDEVFITKEEMKKIAELESPTPDAIAKCIKRLFTGLEIEAFLAKGEERARALQEQLVRFNPEIIGESPPLRQQVDPLLSYEKENPDTFRLSSGSFVVSIEMKDFLAYEKLSEQVYSSQLNKVMDKVIAAPEATP